MKISPYNHKKIEKKWQKDWEKSGIYEAVDSSKLPKFYSLIEFPFPSGDGMHVGHLRSNTAMDIISRKRRAEGFNVLYPIGWDAFGLPTENYAIKTGKHPKDVTKKNTENFRKQLKSAGFSFDWSREINTSDPAYYKWTQWIFLQFYKHDLAYKKKMLINWCPKDKIGLANEEVINGCCERCGTPVEKREKEQWMLAITKYADRLDKDLDTVNYLEKIKVQQRNWIGKSEGAEIGFKIKRGSENLSPALPKGKGERAFGYHTTGPKTWRALQDRVLEMRKNPTRAEETLWKTLKGNATGYHFRRQHIIGNFVVDFVCLEKSLVIEVDGDIHDYQKQEDAERTLYLEENGFKVIRFKNSDVEHNDQKVIENIVDVLKALPFGEGLGEVSSSHSSITVFTTRPDTLYGATYLALAPEHELIQDLLKNCSNVTEIESYIEQAKKKTMIDRTNADKEKTGVELKGVKAINPATKQEIPIFVADYVLADYGTGAIMAVPAHDERDYAFAMKYKVPVTEVVVPNIVDKRNPPIAGKKFVERKNVHAIVKDPKTGKYLALKWKKYDWTTFPMGGIEEGEDPATAAKREVQEETGFTNLKLVKVLFGQVRAEYFAAHKDQNRISYTTAIVFELVDHTQSEIEQSEKDNHDIVWLDKNQLNYEHMTHAEVGEWLNKLSSQNPMYTNQGILINSGKFTGMNSEEAKKKITEFVGGKMVTTYKLRDWVFSRQRYWGEPIPMISCPDCGWVPVPEKELPVKLPNVKNYQPTDTGESPLASMTKWVNVQCPTCKGPAKRETDTMPNWAGSSWYFLRYVDPQNKKEFAASKKLDTWMKPEGVDWYNGGMEHTTLHLLYSRFWNKFLFDIGLVPTSEPYKKRTSHGVIMAEDGEKMSKSRGNVVNPDAIIEMQGADTLRLYEMFMGPFDQAVAWSTDGIAGPRRFLERVWRLQEKVVKKVPFDAELESSINKTIKKVSFDIEAMQFNTAISALMILLNEMEKREQVARGYYEHFLKLLAPFAPHITEEIWSTLGNKKSIHIEKWQVANESKIVEAQVKIIVQVNGKVRGEFMAIPGITENEAKQMALAMPEIIKWVDGKPIRKAIFVKDRLVNLVV